MKWLRRKPKPQVVVQTRRLRLDPEDIVVVIGERILRDDQGAPINPLGEGFPNRVVQLEDPDADLRVLAMPRIEVREAIEKLDDTIEAYTLRDDLR